MKLLQSFQMLEDHDFLILFLMNQRNFNPLIPGEYQVLEKEGLLKDPLLQQVVQYLIDSVSQLSPATYFPIPMIRALKAGKSLTLELTQQFSYPFIKVNAQQGWSLQGKSLDQRIKKHFLENLFYDSAIQRYYVEYKVDNRMDKCYLKCEITPMLGLQLNPVLIERSSEERLSTSIWEIQLNNNKMDIINLDSFRLDEKEQLFCQTENYGEVLLDENARYFVLKNIQENGKSFSLDGQLYSLSMKSP